MSTLAPVQQLHMLQAYPRLQALLGVTVTAITQSGVPTIVQSMVPAVVEPCVPVCIDISHNGPLPVPASQIDFAGQLDAIEEEERRELKSKLETLTLQIQVRKLEKKLEELG